jgi:hypothetical protein
MHVHKPKKAEKRIQTTVTVQPTHNTYIPKPHSHNNMKKYAHITAISD